jgi:hypothetical protein
VAAAAREHRGRPRGPRADPADDAAGDDRPPLRAGPTARLGEIQVKEFDLEQTADAWIFLDLDAGVELGSGDDSTTEVAVRIAASIADKALAENRAVGLTTTGHRMTVLPADRGAPQRHKNLQRLAAVEADGRAPQDEALLPGRPATATGRGPGPMSALRLGRPAEGWITVGLVAALGLVLAWAIDDPSWVNGRGALTDCLPLCALLGAAVGFVGPKAGWGRWTTHAIGALFAALVIPVLAGWAMRPGVSVGRAFTFTASGSVDAYLDLAWYRMALTNQEVHYILVLGVIVWATMQFASYTVFGHRRPIGGVVVAGLILLANMSTCRSRPATS